MPPPKNKGDQCISPDLQHVETKHGYGQQLVLGMVVELISLNSI